MSKTVCTKKRKRVQSRTVCETKRHFGPEYAPRRCQIVDLRHENMRKVYFTRLAFQARLRAIISLPQGIAGAVRQELGVINGRQESERRKR